MSDIEYLTDRCTKMSFLLGISIGALSEVIRDGRLEVCERQRFQASLKVLQNGVDELFYKATTDEQ